MKHLDRLSICLLLSLAACITEDDDDPIADEASSRIAPVAEPVAEPIAPCAPTITAMSQTAFERGTQRFGPGGLGAPGPATFTISGQNHVGSTLLVPDAGSDITQITAQSDSSKTSVSMRIASSTPLGFQQIILRNQCGDSVGGGLWIDPVWAPENVRGRTTGHLWDGVVVSWTQPSRVATETRIERRSTFGGPGSGYVYWTVDGRVTTIVDRNFVNYEAFFGRVYEYRVTNYSETDRSETVSGYALTPTQW